MLVSAAQEADTVQRSFYLVSFRNETKELQNEMEDKGYSNKITWLLRFI